MEPLCTVGGSVNWYSHYAKQYGGSSKKLKIELLYDPGFPLLGKYPKKMKSVSDMASLRCPWRPQIEVSFWQLERQD